jgi:hypothetical protein
MKKIYVVVAETVTGVFPEGEGQVKKSVYQPYGRRVAQVAHVVSKVRFDIMTHELRLILHNVPGLRGYFQDGVLPALIRFTKIAVRSLLHLSSAKFEPITTIVLSCRDSQELEHVKGLMHYHGVSFSDFHDSGQPDYGSTELEVLTAIATWPVEEIKVIGITDYLPLLKAPGE